MYNDISLSVNKISAKFEDEKILMISRFYKPTFDKCMIFYKLIISDKKRKIQENFV